MSEERSILTEYVFLCGDHALEWEVAKFRTPAFEAFMAETMEGPVMRHELRRIAEVTDDAAGCAYCWNDTPGHNVYATFAVDLTIDGDG